MNSRPRFFRLLPLSFVLTSLACGGGGGGGAVKASGLNEGAYTVESFGFTDTKAATYHPLGQSTFPLVRRDEVAHLIKAPGFSIELDDAVGQPSQFEIAATLPDAAIADLEVCNAVSADLDGDGRPELLLVGKFGPVEFESIRVVVLRKDAGSWSVVGSFEPGLDGEHYLMARVDAGDVDGDGRDEILVSATYDSDDRTSWIRVYEDPIQAGVYGTLAQGFVYPGMSSIHAIAAQLDDDGEDEIALHFTEEDQAGGKAYVLDDANHGYMPILTVPLHSSTTVYSGTLVALDRDDDARQELALLLDGGGNLVVKIFDDATQAFAVLRVYDPVPSGSVSNFYPPWLRRAKSGDVNGDGRDELVILVKRSTSTESTLDFRVLWNDGTVTVPSLTYQGQSILHGWDLALADREADSKLEIVACYMTSAAGVCRRVTHIKTFDSASATKLTNVITASSLQLPLTTHVVVAADDFDMDGVRMRWKGIKKLHLPNPIPIAVLAAPPTKGGISQNYDGTEVSYSTSQGETYSYQTTTGHSLSLAVGVDLEDPTGAFGATAKVTLKGAVEKSETSASTVQTSVSFTGGYDQDVVIFQGTLQLTYVYEFVAAADPKVIGTEAAVNISLDTKVYKWTRTFFEDTFGSNSTLPADLFTHAIGDPSTYPTHLAAAALLQTYEGYEGETVTVGQGKGTNGVGLDLETVLTTGTQWSFEMEVEAEVKLGGPTFGITKGITNDWVWENVATEGTSYGAEIGDIQLSSDYFTWGYDAGLFTYARTDSVKPTVQVVSFWTEPWGGGY